MTDAFADTSDTAPSDRTRHKRLPELGSHDPDVIRAILDAGLVAHVATIVDERPVLVPVAYARVGDELVIHGSVASRLFRTLAEGAEACIVVTLLDGLLLARSAFASSMAYRSVVVYGVGRRVDDLAERAELLASLTDHLIPGRAAVARPGNDRELRKTRVLAFPLDEASAKVSVGPPEEDDEADLLWPAWAGEIPLRLTPGTPIPDPDVPAGTPIPDHIAHWTR